MVTWDDSLRLLDARLATQGSRARPLSARTRATYLGDARRVAAWLRQRAIPGPEAVTTTALQAALRARGWAPATRARAITALGEWLDPLFPAGASPVAGLERPRLAPPPTPRLPAREAAALLDGVGQNAPDTSLGRALALRDRALMEVLYGSALRRQEACDLVLAGLDFEHEALRVVGKGARARTVPLTEPAIGALRAWLSDGRPRCVAGRTAERAELEPVFVSRSGRPLDGSTVYRVVSRELRRRGRAGGPHLLRHAAATHLLEGRTPGRGAHLRVVQEVLGHNSIATTQRYTGVTTRAMQDALRQGHPRG